MVRMFSLWGLSRVLETRGPFYSHAVCVNSIHVYQGWWPRKTSLCWGHSHEQAGYSPALLALPFHWGNSEHVHKQRTLCHLVTSAKESKPQKLERGWQGGQGRLSVEVTGNRAVARMEGEQTAELTGDTCSRHREWPAQRPLDGNTTAVSEEEKDSQ